VLLDKQAELGQLVPLQAAHVQSELTIVVFNLFVVAVVVVAVFVVVAAAVAVVVFFSFTTIED
jgi:hypothetical protein